MQGNRSAKKESAMIKALFATLRPAASIATLLTRADDHFLDDIGLTRFDVEQMLRDGPPPRQNCAPTKAQPHAKRAKGRPLPVCGYLTAP